MTGICQGLEALPVAAWEAETTRYGDVEIAMVVETTQGRRRRTAELIEVSLSRDEARRLGEALVKRSESAPDDSFG
jgi:hypothetical protein